jgi:hypothetical protein
MGLSKHRLDPMKHSSKTTREMREQAVRNTHASFLMEGLEFTPEEQADHQAWIDGKISLGECLERAKTRIRTT